MHPQTAAMVLIFGLEDYDQPTLDLVKDDVISPFESNEEVLIDDIPDYILANITACYDMGKRVSDYGEANKLTRVSELPPNLMRMHTAAAALREFMWAQLGTEYMARTGLIPPDHTGVRVKDGKIVYVRREQDEREKLQEALEGLLRRKGMRGAGKAADGKESSTVN